MGSGSESLDDVIAEAWRVFDLPTPRSTGVCKGCCMDREIEADFLNHTARDLPDHYIRDWYFAVFADDLGYAQMGWLLPRVMELLAIGREDFFSGQEVALSRLPQSGFPDRWPPQAVEIVRRFAHALLAQRVTDGVWDLDTTLCTIGNSGLEIGPFLSQLEALPDDALARLLHSNWIYEGRGMIFQTYHWNSQDQRSEVWNWYLSEALENRMIEAGIAGDEMAAAVSDVIHGELRGAPGSSS